MHICIHVYRYIYIYINTHTLYTWLTARGRSRSAIPFCYPIIAKADNKAAGSPYNETHIYIHFKSTRFYVYQALAFEHRTEGFQVSTPHGGELGFRHFRSTDPPQASRLFETQTRAQARARAQTQTQTSDSDADSDSDSDFVLQWRHNGCDSVSNHQPHHCFLNRLFRHRSMKTSTLRVTGLYVGISPEAGEFPAQMASTAENVSIWWRHHGTGLGLRLRLRHRDSDSDPHTGSGFGSGSGLGSGSGSGLGNDLLKINTIRYISMVYNVG